MYSSEFEEEKTVVPSLQIKNPDLIMRAVVKARKSRLKKMSMEISVLKKMGASSAMVVGLLKSDHKES